MLTTNTKANTKANTSAMHYAIISARASAQASKQVHSMKEQIDALNSLLIGVYHCEGANEFTHVERVKLATISNSVKQDIRALTTALLVDLYEQAQAVELGAYCVPQASAKDTFANCKQYKALAKARKNKVNQKHINRVATQIYREQYKADKIASVTQNKAEGTHSINRIEYDRLWKDNKLYLLTLQALADKYPKGYTLQSCAKAVTKEYRKTHTIKDTCNELTFYALVTARKYQLSIDDAQDYAQDLYLVLALEYDTKNAWHSRAKLLVKKYVSNSIQAEKTNLYLTAEQIDALAQGTNGNLSNILLTAEQIAKVDEYFNDEYEREQKRINDNKILTDILAIRYNEKNNVEMYTLKGARRPSKVYSKAQANLDRQQKQARAQALAEIRENSQKFLDTQSAEYKRLFRAIDKNLSKAQAQRVKNLVKYLNKGYSANLIKQKAHTDKKTINKDLQTLASVIDTCKFDVTKATALYECIEKI